MGKLSSSMIRELNPASLEVSCPSSKNGEIYYHLCAATPWILPVFPPLGAAPVISPYPCVADTRLLSTLNPTRTAARQSLDSCFCLTTPALRYFKARLKVQYIVATLFPANSTPSSIRHFAPYFRPAALCSFRHKPQLNLIFLSTTCSACWKADPRQKPRSSVLFHDQSSTSPTAASTTTATTTR